MPHSAWRASKPKGTKSINRLGAQPSPRALGLATVSAWCQAHCRCAWQLVRPLFAWVTSSYLDSCHESEIIQWKINLILNDKKQWSKKTKKKTECQCTEQLAKSNIVHCYSNFLARFNVLLIILSYHGTLFCGSIAS
jgi:hypothetical protein